MEAERNPRRYTHLFARISEEEDGYTILVRLHHEVKPRNAAWGEEIADSLETASMLVAALAAEFSIPESRIEIEVQMNDVKSGVLH